MSSNQLMVDVFDFGGDPDDIDIKRYGLFPIDCLKLKEIIRSSLMEKR